MSLKPFTTQIVGHEVTEHIYVKSDGKTVCGETDRDVSHLAYAKGERISEAQKAALVFPGASAEPVPDASQRSAPEVPDNSARKRK